MSNKEAPLSTEDQIKGLEDTKAMLGETISSAELRVINQRIEALKGEAKPQTSDVQTDINTSVAKRKD